MDSAAQPTKRPAGDSYDTRRWIFAPAPLTRATWFTPTAKSRSRRSLPMHQLAAWSVRRTERRSHRRKPDAVRSGECNDPRCSSCWWANRSSCNRFGAGDIGRLGPSSFGGQRGRWWSLSDEGRGVMLALSHASSTRWRAHRRAGDDGSSRRSSMRTTSTTTAANSGCVPTPALRRAQRHRVKTKSARAVDPSAKVSSSCRQAFFQVAAVFHT